MSLCRRLLRSTGAFSAIAVVSGSVLAEPQLDTRPSKTERAAARPVACAGVAVFPIEGELECVPPALVFVPARSVDDRAPDTGRVERDRATAASYRGLLADLVIAHDLEVPGVPIGVRLIPSRSALAGPSARVALIPRFVGTSWYGAEIVASF